MNDIDLFTYRHRQFGKKIPSMQFEYYESDTGNSWRIWGNNDLLYLYRTGEKLKKRDDSDRVMDSDLMVRRLECSMLMAKEGWFNFTCISRWMLTDLTFCKTSYVGCGLIETKKTDLGAVYDWFQSFSNYNLLRRAAEDAYNALTIPSEAIFFLYRGFEWLKKCCDNVGWDKLGKEIDIPQVNIDEIKKIANDNDVAARHATKTGHKVRFEQGVCSGWVCGLLHGIVHARCKLDTDYKKKIEKLGDPWPI